MQQDREEIGKGLDYALQDGVTIQTGHGAVTDFTLLWPES